MENGFSDKKINMSLFKTIITAFLFLPLFLNAQTNLPLEVKITQDGRLTYGGNPTEGLYNLADVHKLEITLTEPNWFQLLDGSGGPGGSAGQSLVGTLTFNDTLVLDSVLVSIKGQTSDSQNNSEKKSFKIEIDELKNQDLMGYDNLNLNCAFQDHSSMREVLYYDISRAFAPALKGAFVDLYINGQYWGPYNNIQQIEGTYIKEWFTDNDGTRWRAVSPDGFGGPGGPGGPGGNPFGAGVSTLNYNGPDSTDYNENYTLKKTSKDNPWEDLIIACEQLNSLPISELYDELKYYIDIDRALWFLAQEAVFSDDDSYIHKGGMDYYVYWDHATNRIMPLEVDGNSVMVNNHVNWSPFYHEDDSNFPLLNRLMQNEEVRQRYLAHLRTVLELHFTETEVHDRIDEFAALLDQRVQDDPKKIYSYNQYINGISSLKGFITNRIDYLSNHTEINREGVEISNMVMETSAGTGNPPAPNEEVQVTIDITGDAQKVVLYYGLGVDGVFERVEMFDDGMHNDGLANDQKYGANIPGFSVGNYVRFYVEAIKDDNFSTASYFPAGAEHDVFIYQVEQAIMVDGDVAINEFMASNDGSISDGAGEYDDWIELYNKGNEAIDLSGYFLSDDEGDITKWQFPDNTTIEPDGYLIIWADDDEEQTTADELHANFKLSAGGEQILLVNADQEIIDLIAFNEQQTDASFARIPNGTGDFQFRTETFNANNDGSTTDARIAMEANELSIYPNPSSNYIAIGLEGVNSKTFEVVIFDTTGKKFLEKNISRSGFPTSIDLSGLGSGVYYLLLNDTEENLRYSQKIMIVK